MLSKGTAIVLIVRVCNSWGLFIMVFVCVCDAQFSFLKEMSNLSVLLCNKWGTVLLLHSPWGEEGAFKRERWEDCAVCFVLVKSSGMAGEPWWCAHPCATPVPSKHIV